MQVLFLLLGAGLLGWGGQQAYVGGLLSSSDSLVCEVGRLFSGTGESCAVTGNQAQVRFDEGLARRPVESGREDFGLGAEGVGSGDVVVETELGLTGTGDSLTYGQVAPLEGAPKWAWTPNPGVPPPPSPGDGWRGKLKRAVGPVLAIAAVFGPEGGGEGEVHEEWLADGSRVVVFRGDDPEVIAVERCGGFVWWADICVGDREQVIGRLRDGVYVTEAGEIVARETPDGWETYFPTFAQSGSPHDYVVRVVKENHGGVEVLVPRFFNTRTGRMTGVLFWEETPVHLERVEYRSGSDSVRRVQLSADGEKYVVRVYSDGTFDLGPLLEAGLCFVAGTQVHTPLGLRAIETIGVGDEVWAKDAQSGEVSLKRVRQTFRREGREVLSVTVLDGLGKRETYGVTPSHPFWVGGLGWVEAGALTPGSELGSREGAALLVESVERRSERATVYNFEVEDAHTYFVGEGGAWVHNECAEAVVPRLEIGNADLHEAFLKPLLANHLNRLQLDDPLTPELDVVSRRIVRELEPILHRLGVRYEVVQRGQGLTMTHGLRLVDGPGLGRHIEWSRSPIMVDSQSLIIPRNGGDVTTAELQLVGNETHVVISPALLYALLRGDTNNNFFQVLARAQSRQLAAANAAANAWSPYTLEVIQMADGKVQQTHNLAAALVDARFAQLHGGPRGLNHSTRALTELEIAASVLAATLGSLPGYPIHDSSVTVRHDYQQVGRSRLARLNVSDPFGQPVSFDYLVHAPRARGRLERNLRRLYDVVIDEYRAAAQRDVQLALPDLFDAPPAGVWTPEHGFPRSRDAILDAIGQSYPGRLILTKYGYLQEYWLPGYLIHVGPLKGAAALQRGAAQREARLRQLQFGGSNELPEIPPSIVVEQDPRMAVMAVPPDAHFLLRNYPDALRTRVEALRTIADERDVPLDAEDIMYSPEQDRIYIIRPGVWGEPTEPEPEPPDDAA